MTSQALKPPPGLHPRLKSAAARSEVDTVDAVSTSASASASTPGSSRAGSPTPSGPHGAALRSRPSQISAAARRRPVTQDALSDKSTTTLIRRTLCTNTPNSAGDTLRRDAPLQDLLPPLTSSNEVDLQLYAFLAIMIREFITPWYARITPDQGFVEELVRVVAHCTRALEERLRRLDLSRLLLDQLPQLFEAHYKAFRTSTATDLRHTYHALRPHPALSPVPADAALAATQSDNETAYRHLLVQHILEVILPADDAQNDCLRALVQDIFADIVLERAVIKLTETSLLWELILKGIEQIHQHETHPAESLTQRLRQWTVSLLSTIPRLFSLSTSTFSNTKSGFLPAQSLHFFTAIAAALDLSARLPWLTGLIALIGRLAPEISPPSTPVLQRPITPHIPTALRNLRGSLFPGNTLPTRAEDRSEEEGGAGGSRQECARAILGLLPPTAKRVYFGTTDEKQQLDDLEETLLAPLAGGSENGGDAYVMKHLLYSLLDCCVAEVLPELKYP